LVDLDFELYTGREEVDGAEERFGDVSLGSWDAICTAAGRWEMLPSGFLYVTGGSRKRETKVHG
jgi:hypothetical protein